MHASLSRYYKKPLVLAIACASTSYTNITLAESPALEEIVVTAQKREQNLQDTPIAISAFDAKALEDKGVSDVEDVSQYTPNLQVAESPGGSTGATIGIRGSVTVNPVVTMETNVGLYIDGVFIAKNVGGLFDVAELERLEILRGPQGTLYGKNTVGGAVNLITRKPSGEMGGKARLGLGNFGYRDIYLSMDSESILDDKLSLNFAVNKKDRNGFYENLSVSPDAAGKFKELDSLSYRLAALYDFSDDTEIYYSYDSSDKDNTPSFGQTSGGPKKRLNKGAADGAKYDRSESSGHALHITHQLGDFTLKSITAYREMTFDDSNDYDGKDEVSFHAERHADQSQTSQEFQLNGDFDRFNFVTGLFLFNEEVDVQNPLTSGTQFGPFVRDNSYGAKSKSIAIYGQGDYNVSDLVTLTAGLRWTREEKDGYVNHPQDSFLVVPNVFTGQNYNVNVSKTWSNVSPMFVVTLYPADNITTYLKFAEGWKSGGFNAEAPSKEIAEKPFDDESVRSIELGLKSRWLDDRLQANIALFNNQIEGLQLSQVNGVGYSEISNAGESTVQGFELESLFALTDQLLLSFNYGYLDAKYDSFKVVDGNGVTQDVKDSRLFPYAPESKASLGLEFYKEVKSAELSARVDWSYTDEFVVYHDPVQAAATKVEEHDILNARLTLSGISVGDQGNELTLALWGKNLTDSEYRMNGIPLRDKIVNYYGDPRTFGLDVSVDF